MDGQGRDVDMTSRTGSPPPTIGAYLSRVPRERRPALEELRKTIRSVAPEAEEVISYRMPAFRQSGMLVWYAGFKDHCSFFVGSGVVLRKFGTELAPFKAGKGTLQFKPKRPIPVSLVRRIVRARIAEYESRASSKRRAAKSSSKKPQR